MVANQIGKPTISSENRRGASTFVDRMERSVNRFEIVNSDGTPDDLKDPKG
jgi:hypothetical protein